MKNLTELSIEELKDGFVRENGLGDCERLTCIFCGETFYSDEVYEENGHFYLAERMMATHLRGMHADHLRALFTAFEGNTGLTETQQNILGLIYAGHSDKEIAGLTGVTPATIRKQRFNLREKAKQAKLFLAAYDTAFKNDDMIPVHDHAKMVDDRYVTTEDERKQTLDTMFYSLSPMKLKQFPAREKKKIIVLQQICTQFEKGIRYQEPELNEILKDIFPDYPTIRRYLIEYGFMDRTKDCKEYWIK